MKEDLSLESLRRRPHWSFSSINGLINFCSLKWAFQYVYREEPLFTPVALVFGSVYHKALTFAFGRMARGEEVTSIECTELFADLLSRKLADCEPEIRLGETDTIDSLIGCGQRIIAAYLESVDTVETIHAVSVPFSVPLRATDGTIAGKPLIGEFDLTVSAKDGTYTVVDWKTSSRRWPETRARTDLQATCYLFAHWMSVHEEARFRFDVVTKAKQPACEKYVTRRDPHSFDRLVHMVVALERLIQAEAFTPQDGSWECRDCPYSLACQSWHRERASTQVHFDLAA